MKLHTALVLAGLILLTACAKTYSGYRSDCACDFEKMAPVDLEFV